MRNTSQHDTPPADQSSAILIVDDHHDIRASLQEWLEHQGYRTVGCSSAADALTVLQSGESVCLILLDLMMPTISGFQFREQQRASAAIGHIPVAVISAAPQPQDYHGNLQAVAYLRKPVDPHQVLALARQHCGPRRTVAAPLRNAEVTTAGSTDGTSNR